MLFNDISRDEKNCLNLSCFSSVHNVRIRFKVLLPYLPLARELQFIKSDIHSLTMYMQYQ